MSMLMSNLTPAGLTTSEKYIFDTNGYIVLKNVYSLEEIQRANETIDAHVQRGDLVRSELSILT
jgi:hypothetical protein